MVVLRSFSPLLDGDGVASAPELPHSTTLTGRPGSLSLADSVSASHSPRSANPAITTRHRNSLRTRILRIASSPPSVPATSRLKSFPASPPLPAGPHAAGIHQ